MVIFKNCPSVLSLSLIHCHLSAASPNHNLISAVTITPTAVHQLQRLCRVINPTFCPTDRNLKLETVTWTNLIFRGFITTEVINPCLLFDCNREIEVSPLFLHMHVIFCAELENMIFRQPLPRK